MRSNWSWISTESKSYQTSLPDRLEFTMPLIYRMRLNQFQVSLKIVFLSTAIVFAQMCLFLFVNSKILCWYHWVMSTAKHLHNLQFRVYLKNWFYKSHWNCFFLVVYIRQTKKLRLATIRPDEFQGWMGKRTKWAT